MCACDSTSVKLVQAGIDDAPEIHAMQLRAFFPLYMKYRDDETSPAMEPVEKVRARLAQQETSFFFIDCAGRHVGAIRVQKRGDACRISPVFILPEDQGQGYAQQALHLVEQCFPDARCWRLDTILQEPGNCHLYEKLGYVRTGRYHDVNERMTLVDYEKRISTNPSREFPKSTE